MRTLNILKNSVLREWRTLPTLAALAAVALGAGSASAAPIEKRLEMDIQGDFLVIGNTLGYDCRTVTPNPVVVGTVGACGSSTSDSAPDVFWRAADADSAEASTAIAPAAARSTAVLHIPATATVERAFLYWSATSAIGPDTGMAVTLERPGVGGFSQSITAGRRIVEGTQYQSVAEVTTLIDQHGSGAYRLSSVAVRDFRNTSQNVNFAAWTLVVFYRDAGEPTRNLVLFDGLHQVTSGNPANAVLDGFLVPNAGFDAKLGVVAYEGDGDIDGDALFFGTGTLGNSDRLTDGVGAVTNFFNGSRTWDGTAVSVVGDLPQLTGGLRSMAGYDLDVVDISSRLTHGQTSANIRASSTGDQYYLGMFVTSISTYKPNFTSSTKTVTDLNGDGVVPGDTLEYTITVRNDGNDDSILTVLNDTIPVGMTFVPGSLRIDGVGKTDAATDDEAEYNDGTRSLTARLGAGANASVGGSIAIGGSSTVTFQVTIDAGATGTLSNQASITFEGDQGAPQDTQPTDGSSDPGSQPTDIIIDHCNEDTDCSAATPICATSLSPQICVQCLSDADCGGAEPTCNLGTFTCECSAGPGACLDSDGDGLTDVEELALGTDPFDADSDDDGLLDGEEIDPGLDSDGDGLINALDPDSDNDGLFDGTEMGKDCSHADTDPAAQACRADADPTTTTDPLKWDTDDGGVSDGSEDANLNGRVDADEADPNDASDDGSVVDTDGDGLSDLLELFLGSDPNDADSDDDGVPDGEEPNPSHDTDGDGLINILDVDSDNDALYDGTEMGYSCDGPGTDASRNHCIPDGDLGATKTSPLLWDTDGGGASDGSEDWNRNGVVDAGETDPTAGNGADDASVVDTDGDGLGDSLEVELGSDPNNADSDNDGLLDGDEPNPGDDHDGDGLINLLDPDSDGDGLPDGLEAGRICDHPDTDTSLGICLPDGDAGATTTGVLQRDTDGGGATDGEEDVNRNGVVDSGERDPNDPSDDSTSPTGGAGGVGGSAGSAGAAGAGGTAGTAGSGTGGTGNSSFGGTAGQGGSGAQGGSAQGDEGFSLEGGGCGCAVPAGKSNSAPLALALGALGAAAMLRRRRRS